MKSQAAMRRALVIVHRYTLDISAIARSELGTGSSNREVQVLTLLRMQRGITPRELAEATGSSRPAISHVLSPLVREGLIERRPHKTDRRSTRLVLSRRGRESFRNFESRMLDHFVAGAPLVKEVVRELGSDPGPSEAREGSAHVLDVLWSLSTAGGAYVADVEVRMDTYGATQSTDRYALALLAEFHQLRPGQLAEELLLTPSGTTDLANRLESLGLVHRSYGESGDDRRTVSITLTPKGHQAQKAMLRVFERHSEPILTAMALTLAASPSPQVRDSKNSSARSL